MSFSDRRKGEERGEEGKYVPQVVTGAEFLWLDAQASSSIMSYHSLPTDIPNCDSLFA